MECLAHKVSDLMGRKKWVTHSVIRQTPSSLKQQWILWNTTVTADWWIHSSLSLLFHELSLPHAAGRYRIILKQYMPQGICLEQTFCSFWAEITDWVFNLDEISLVSHSFRKTVFWLHQNAKLSASFWVSEEISGKLRRTEETAFYVSWSLTKQIDQY